jgi:hypothetical protein
LPGFFFTIKNHKIMAKVLFGQGVAGIRGTVGGSIFSQNKGGPYIKNYAVPTNPKTEKQMAVRTAFNYINTLWAALTDLQRLGWESLAAQYPFIGPLGQEYFLTGKQFFQKVNSVVHQLNEDPFPDAPVSGEVPKAPEEYSIAGSEAGTSITISSDEATVPADTKFVIDGAPPSLATKNNNNSLFKRLTFLDAAANWDTVNVYTNYVAVFGAPIEGQKVELRTAAFSKITGRLSEFVKASCIMAA